MAAAAWWTMTASKPVAEECEEALDRVDEVSRVQTSLARAYRKKSVGWVPALD